MVHGQRSGGPSPSDLTLCHNIEFGRARFDAGSAIDENSPKAKHVPKDNRNDPGHTDGLGFTQRVAQSSKFVAHENKLESRATTRLAVTGVLVPILR